MTAVGAFSLLTPAPVPILIGDLALTGPEPDHDVLVPTIGSTSDVFARVPGYPGEIVKGCVQKVILCHDRLAVAWAGNRIAAQAVLRELEGIANPDVDSLTTVIEGQGDSAATRDLELVGFLAEPHDVRRDAVWVRGFQTAGNKIKFAGAPAFRGTGAKLMAHAFEQDTRRWGGEDAEAGALGISAILSAIGQLMSLERTALQPLLQYFGGGYEVAFWNDQHRRFEKLESAVHLFWKTAIGARGKLILEPYRALRPTYVAKTLVVHAATAEPLAEGMTKRLERYLISPPHHDPPSTVAINPVRFGGAGWTCNHFLIETADGQRSTIITSVSSGPERPILITDLADGFKLEFTSRFLDNVAEIAAGVDPIAIRQRRNQQKRERRRRR